MQDAAQILWQTVAPRPPAAAADSTAVQCAAIRGCPRIRELVARCARLGVPLLVVINDPHRSTRTDLALAALTEVLGGWPAGFTVEVLVATGTHDFPPRERAAFERRSLASTALAPATVHWHEATNAAGLAPCGPARFNRVLLAHQAVLAIGSVEPHYFAGLTGAHKTATIGCLAREDIERNHAGALDPASDILALRGNPIYDGAAALLHALCERGRQVVALNQVLCGGHVVAAAAGDALETLDRLLPVVREVYVHQVERPVDILHLHVPDPLGRNLYQADKALKNNHLAVRDGGVIVLDAPCAEGIGPDAFMTLLRRAPDYATARRLVLQEGYRLGDHKAVKLRHLTDSSARGVRLAIVSPHVHSADAAACGAERFDTIEPALEWAARAARPAAEGLLGLRVEDAGMTVAVARQGSADRRRQD